MIIGIGTDIVQINRIDTARRQFGDKFVKRILTPAEQEKMETIAPIKQSSWIAKRFAGKEAFVKALGCGFGQFAQWNEIEILNNEQGAPTLSVFGKTADTLRKKAHNTRIHISLSDDENATAFVIIEQQ